MGNNNRHCTNLESKHLARTVHISVNIDMRYLKFHEFYIFILNF